MIRTYGNFRLYPNAVQAAALERQRRMHCDLYNGLIQQRIEAYSRQGRTLTYYDQCKELTALRADDPEYAAMSSASMAATAQRVDRAFQAFFRRAKQGMGHRAGFPRFKSGRFYPGFSFKRHRSGWAVEFREASDGRPTHGRLRIKGVPRTIRVRGRHAVPADGGERPCGGRFRFSG